MDSEGTYSNSMHLFGFDGFGQLTVCKESITSAGLPNVIGISFSWANCLLLCTSAGEHPDMYLAGLICQKKQQLDKLALPVKEHDIIDVIINSKSVLILTGNNEIWRLTLSTKKWDNITSIFFAQQEGSLTEVTKPHVRRIVGGEGLNVALLSNGILMNIPNVINQDPLKFEIADIAVGIDHAIFLSSGGIVFTYGSGGRGQLGHGELENEENLREVRALSGIKIVEIVAGGWHCIARSYCGDLYGWGWNNWGQLSIFSEEEDSVVDFKGIVVPEPTLMNWPTDDVNVTQVACGTRHTIALLDDGSVWGCGWNGHNQLPGLDSNESAVYPVMSQLKVSSEKKVSRIACGSWNSAFCFS
nr:PREDICTED: probable E3 ubiquitin-protein ligase HERC3 [Bemisia tabaci]XP_018908361.1 PREDICTED: probable E3 ubiquitin-protein ligase HERC3 [Bemisia tabaci]